MRLWSRSSRISEPRAFQVTYRQSPRLHDTGVEVEIVRHNGRTEYAKRQIQHVGIRDNLCRWSKAEDHLTPIRIGKSDLNRKADGDNAEQSYDKRFDQRKPSFCR